VGGVMLDTKVIPINFGQGLDTKTDPKGVVAGKLLRLENGVFTAPNQIAKRNGTTSLGTTVAGGTAITAPKMAYGYGNELLLADANRLLSYSSNQSAWINKGNFTSVELSRSAVFQDLPASGFCDVAILGNYALYIWSTAEQQSITPNVYSKTYASIVDISTGVQLVSPQVLSTDTAGQLNHPKALVLGGTTLAVVYMKPDETALYSRTVTFSGSGVVAFSAETTVSTGFVVAAGGEFDAIGTSAGGAVAYFTAAGLTVSLLNTSGAVTSSASIVDATVYRTIYLSTTSNGNIWVYWETQNGAAGTIQYAVYSSALAVVLASTTLSTLASPYLVTNITSVASSATQQTAYWGIYVSSTGNFIDQTKYVTATSAGVVGVETTFKSGVTPISRPATIGSDSYATFIYRGGNLGTSGLNDAQIQPTYFMLRLSDGYVVSRFGSGLGNSQASLQINISHVGNLWLYSTYKAYFACAVETQGFPSDIYSTLEFFPAAFSGVFSYLLDFNGANAYSADTAGQLAMFNGGVVQAYDGRTVSEWGFHLFPEITDLTQSNTAGGAIANGTYSYLAVFQWTDALGNLHQSTPSDPVSIVTTGLNDTVTITATLAFLSAKSNVAVAFYRTQNAGSVYFLVSDPVFITSADASGSSVTATFIDTFSDANIAGNPQPYTYPASAVLENTTPPPSIVMTAHNNRLFFVDAENPNSEWYTKTFSPGTGLSPSGFLLQQIDPKLGAIVASSEMDANIVRWTATGLFAQAGDGANDTGNGISFSTPQPIPSDVGCSEMKSVVLTPRGVMFKSPNGIYLIDRALNVSYIGAEVESYNSQTITGATLVPGKSQIRFLCSSGYTLVYDYIFNQWSTFTGYTGVGSTTWGTSYVYASATLPLKETPGTYADNGSGFALLLQTSWLALGGIQGFQRVRRLIMLGDFINGNSASHNLSIAAAYDFSTTFQTAVTYAFGAASASGVFQYREGLPIQKCDTISLLIQETTTGSSAEYIDLTNISFEAAVKRGVNKLGGAYSVG
jgi:hypothetical protein